MNWLHTAHPAWSKSLGGPRIRNWYEKTQMLPFFRPQSPCNANVSGWPLVFQHAFNLWHWHQITFRHDDINILFQAFLTLFFFQLFYRRQLRQLHRLGLQKRDSVCVRIWVEGYRILRLPPTRIPDQPDLHWDYEGSESHRIRPAEEVRDRQGQISIYMTELQLRLLSYLSQHLIFLFGIQYSSQILSGDALTRTSIAWILICFSCFLTLFTLFSLSCDTIWTDSCGVFCDNNQRTYKWPSLFVYNKILRTVSDMILQGQWVFMCAMQYLSLISSIWSSSLSEKINNADSSIE